MLLDVKGELRSTASLFSGSYSNHSFIVSADHVVYGLGSNSEGQLGSFFSFSQEGTHRVLLRAVASFQQIACGRDHTLFLTEYGDVLSAGYNGYLQLGRDSEEQNKTTASGIIQIACGGYSSYCLTKQGSLLAFGYNMNFQLGVGVDITQSARIQVPFPMGVRIAQVSAGYAHVAALAEDGSLYTFGLNSQGQIGRSGPEDVPATVQFPRVGQERIRRVQCGSFHTCVVFSDCILYCFGRNDKGQLGVGDTMNRQTPTEVTFFHGNPIRTLSVGGNHTIVLLKSGDFVGFGSNLYHQLQDQDQKMYISPVKLVGMVAGERILGVCCGCNHTLLTVEDGSCYGRGYQESFGKMEDMTFTVKIADEVEVVRGGMNEYLDDLEAEDMSLYIQQEQDLLQSERTTDMELHVYDDETVHSLHINREFMLLKCPNLIRFCDRGEQLEIPGILTSDMKRRLLIYLYADQVELGGLSASDLISLHSFLSKLEICDRLRVACEMEIESEIFENRTAIYVYEEAVNVNNERLRFISLREIRRDLAGYRNHLSQKREDGEDISEIEEAIEEFPDTLPSITQYPRRVEEPHAECMKRLYNRKIDDGDVNIRVSGEKSLIKAHSFVLAKVDFFRNEIDRIRRESNAKEKRITEIKVDAALVGAIDSYLKFIYLGDLDLTVENSIRISSYLKRIGFNGESHKQLMRYCDERLQYLSLSRENCMDILRIAVEVGMDDLKVLTLDFISRNYRELKPQIEGFSLELQLMIATNTIEYLYKFAELPDM